MTQALNIFALGVGGGASTTDATSYATASVTPTTGRTTILACISSRAAGVPNDPTASGAGLTLTRRFALATPSNLSKLAVFTAPNTAPSTGAITIDYGGQTQDGCGHVIFEVDADVADIIVQSITGTVTAGTTYTLTLGSAFASPLNATLAIVGCDLNTGSLRVEQGYGVPDSSSSAAVAVPFRDATPYTIAYGFRPNNDSACVVTQGSGNGAGVLIELRNPNAIQAGAYSLSGTVTQGATPVSGATVRVIDRTTGDSRTVTTDGAGAWSLSVNFNTASRYAAMAEWNDSGTLYQALAPWSITAA